MTRQMSVVVSRRDRTIELEDVPTVLTEREAERLVRLLALAASELHKRDANPPTLRLVPDP